MKREEANAILKEEIETEERLKMPPVQMDAFIKPCCDAMNRMYPPSDYEIAKYRASLKSKPPKLTEAEEEAGREYWSGYYGLKQYPVKPVVLADSKAVMLAYLEIQGVKVRQPKCRKDDRGWLAEVWRSDEDNALEEPSPEMAYVSVTKPGVSRGPHEHIHQTDRFVFLTGSWRVKLWDNRKCIGTTGRVMILELSQPTVVIVPPGVVHAYVNVSLRSAMVLNLPDKLYRGKLKLEEVDEIRHEENKKYSLNDVMPWWSKIRGVK